MLCCGCSSEHVSPTDFAGTWFLNDKDTSYGGEMVISNCVDSTCDFTLAAWNGYYTCMADGKITVNKNRAEYKTTTVAYNDATNQMEQTDVGIMFHMARVANLKADGKKENFKGKTDYLTEFTRAADEIRAGKTESDYIPFEATRSCMLIMDECRRQMNLVYPFEK